MTYVVFIRIINMKNIWEIKFQNSIQTIIF